MAAKPKTPKLSAAALASNYGWALATLNSSPDLKKLFTKAVAKQYTPERFIAELRNTNWFKKNSESQRKLIVLKTTDPSQYAAQITQVMASMADQYSQATGEILPYTPPKIVNGKIVAGSGFLYTSALQSLSMGLNEAQIKDQLFKSIDWSQKIATDTLGGSTSGTLQQMRQQAASMGVAPTESWYADQVGKIALGNDTADGAAQRIKQLSMQRYSAFADRIDAGESVADISEGYRQSYGKVLEINPATVDVFDSKIQNALTNRNQDGADAPQSIGDFERSLRQDDRWQFTNNAKDTLMGQGASLLKQFGISA